MPLPELALDVAGYAAVKEVLGRGTDLMSRVNATDAVSYAAGDLIYMYWVRGSSYFAGNKSPVVGSGSDELRKAAVIAGTQLATNALMKGRGLRVMDVVMSVGAASLVQTWVLDPYFGPNLQRMM